MRPDLYCCDDAEKGAGCSCEHGEHTAEGRMACNDCGRQIFYNYDDEQYHHALEPERGCFLIPAEIVPEAPPCPNGPAGHRLWMNNEVTQEFWCPICGWQGYPELEEEAAGS